jgi:hypothetical protein
MKFDGCNDSATFDAMWVDAMWDRIQDAAAFAGCVEPWWRVLGRMLVLA